MNGNHNNLPKNLAETEMLGTNPSSHDRTPSQDSQEHSRHRQYQPLQQPKPVDGDLTYRVPPLQITLATARTVSRPELVVEGLKDMCNLVEYSEPENPSSSLNLKSYQLDQNSSANLNLTSQPIPPPTAFDAGLSTDTERMFSNLALSMDPPEEREEVPRRRKSSYHKKIVTSPRSRAMLSRCVGGQADDDQICQVLYNMISLMESETSEQDDKEQSPQGQNPPPTSGATLSVQSQVNATTAATATSQPSLGPGCQNQKVVQDRLPEKTTSSQQPQTDINQNPVPTGELGEDSDSYIQPKPRSSLYRDTMQYIHQPNQPSLTMPKTPQQQCRSSISCQCNLYDQQEQEKCQELELESKSTSTTDVANNDTAKGPAPLTCAMTYAVIQSQSSQNHQILNDGQLQPQQNQYPPTIMSTDGGNGQQPVPIYILQTTPNQQMPIFLVQNGGNPGGGIMGQQQTPIFLQQVQCQQFSPQNQNLAKTPEVQVEQSEVPSIKLTRVETRTLLKPTIAFPKCDFTKEMVPDQKQQKATSTKSLENRSELQLPPLQQSGTKAVQIEDHDREGEVTFIVGPSPIETYHEVETLHHHRELFYPQKKHGIQSKPELRLAPQFSERRKKQSYSDTQVDKVNKQQRKAQDEQIIIDQKNWHKSDQDQAIYDYKKYSGCQDASSGAVATPNTSSHTVTIRTYVRTDNEYRPSVSTPEEEEQGEDEESLYDPDCTLSYQNYSNSEAEPEPRPRQAKYGDAKKNAIRFKGEKPQNKLQNKENSEKRKKSGNEERSAEPNSEIVDYPTGGEPLEVWQPNFMKDKKPLPDQMEFDSLLSEKSVEEGICLIEDTSSWEKNVFGLKVISLKVQFYEGDILERLPCLVASIQKHIRASGSKLARQAILTLRDLFIILGPHFDPYLNSLAERLFSKMANTNKFIKDDCELTLESMVDHCSQPKMIQILENVARRHKHSLIRLVANKMITKFVALVGPNAALEDYAHLILPLLCSNLGERTGEIRDEAKSALRLLVPNPDFDAYMRHHVNPQFIYSICEKLERIREEVSDRPRIRPKITRNHSLFKWQQKFSNVNLM